MNSLWTFISAVVGVFAVSALFGWMMFRAAKPWDRAASDPRYRRQKLFLLYAVYVLSMVVGIGEVLRRNQPVQSLLGLPIPLLIAYWLMRTASRTKVPPQ
jgi:hypothetical protein